jgi:hypothetical protein
MHRYIHIVINAIQGVRKFTPSDSACGIPLMDVRDENVS